ncbi:hypothetical protein KR215_004983, partial [Drosophila sulfurigaster]
KTNNNDFNADELVAPEWLNAEFLREVLMKHLKEPELKVLDIVMSPASAKGDHYASVMFRSKVVYETQKGKFSKSLIIKTMPEQEGHKKEMLSNSHIFEIEIGMYTKALPKFEEILRHIEKDIVQKFIAIIEEYRSNRQLDGYYILCHGDFHLRNMMFKHNSTGGLEDCMLLDYQMSNVCPPSVDILYSIYLLMGPDERRNHHKELINFYFNTFVETL